jgi:hypothetical protein
MDTDRPGFYGREKAQKAEKKKLDKVLKRV